MLTAPSGKNIFRIQLLAVVAGAVLLAAKFTAYAFTHSNTILTDALESIINVVAGAFALYSLHLSSKPKDFDHPYGHGKVEFISAGFEGILVVLSGIAIIIKAIFSFFEPVRLEHLNAGVAVIIVSGLVNYGLGFILVRAGKNNDSLTLQADGQHLKSDAYSAVGVAVGLVLIILTKVVQLDNVVAIIFGLVIIYMGVRLVRKSIAGIMDEADTGVIETIVEEINARRKPIWIDIHNLRVIQFGNRLHVDCHVTLPWYLTLKVAHDEMEEIARIVNEKQGHRVEFFIHGDPCVPKSCAVCMIEDCKVRQQPFKGRVLWTSAVVRGNHKHGEELLKPQ